MHQQLKEHIEGLAHEIELLGRMDWRENQAALQTVLDKIAKAVRELGDKFESAENSKEWAELKESRGYRRW